jgi:hypothetical protein
MNNERAKWARKALGNFSEITGCDKEDALSDLLCNLMHMCDRESGQGFDFEEALDRARRNYQAEISGIEF